MKATDLTQAQHSNGDTPLHLAALHDGYDVVQILLDSGADLTAKNLYLDPAPS